MVIFYSLYNDNGVAKKEVIMKLPDKRLFTWIEPVWTEVADGDCNPDLIPCALCDAAEIGFNKGFTAGLYTMQAVVAGTAAGCLITEAVLKKKK